MKIVTIIGARPQFIKAAPVSEKIKSSAFLNEIIIHTGQHFDKKMSDVFFEEINLPKPKYNLNINQVGHGLMVERMVKKITPILKREEAKGVLVYGDTNSTLAGSIAAKLLKIPIFHVEAGLRSFNREMNEEVNRIITDHFSSILFCPNENAVKNLKKEKISNDIIVTGDVMYDAFLKFSCFKDDLDNDLIKSKFILATIHRRENINSAEKLSAIFNNLNKINDSQKIIMPLHPHTKKKIEKYEIQSNITFTEPLGYISMLSFLNECEMVITDSGGLQKESFFAKKKCLTVREQTEWNELINQGTNVLCKPENLKKAYYKISNEECDFSNNFYGDGNASGLIMQSIENFFSK